MMASTTGPTNSPIRPKAATPPSTPNITSRNGICVALLMTSANPPGQQQLVLSVSSGDVTALVVGLLMLAFALVMQEGVRLDEDNRSIL